MLLQCEHYGHSPCICNVNISDIADALCYLLVGTSEQAASQGIELVTRTPQEMYEIVSLIG